MRRGFTLSELLIALAILGIIAVFTIPKVLQAQQDNRYRSTTKEAIAAIVEGWHLYKLKNKPDANSNFWDVYPYINYARFSNSAADVVDFHQGMTTADCSWGGCLYLHNGGVIYFFWQPFGGTASTNAIMFYFDPDGKVTTSASTTDGPGKAVNLQLYFDGKVSTRGTVYPGTSIGGINYTPEPNYDPPWFNWN